MRKVLFLSAVLAFVGPVELRAHDMFLKMKTFFLPPQAPVAIALFNGTFDKSENAIGRDRMQDVSIVGPENEVEHPSDAQWRDESQTSWLDFRAGRRGSYVAGVSTRPRVLELSGEEFDEYLEHDGVLDVLEARTREGELRNEARERYSKHVKAIFQVGERRSGAYRHLLGYPVEFVPGENPYRLKAGDHFEVVLLRDGEAVPNHLVYASYEGFHGQGDGDRHREAVKTRTNADGVARFELKEPGMWYVRTIHMVRVDEPDVDYESNWATLTFQVRQR
ncbi:MAG: DUF4198 domain-containing protein [Acidobacteriota bacterium]